MKKLLYIALLTLVSCAYDNELPEPVNYSQDSYFDAAEIDSSTTYITGVSTTTTGQNIFEYTSKGSHKLNIKSHVWLSNPSYGLHYYISLNGKPVKRNDVGNQSNFNGPRDIVLCNLQVNPGDEIKVNVGQSSIGETTIYPSGSHLGNPSDKSFITIESF